MAAVVVAAVVVVAAATSLVAAAAILEVAAAAILEVAVVDILEVDISEEVILVVVVISQGLRDGVLAEITSSQIAEADLHRMTTISGTEIISGTETISDTIEISFSGYRTGMTFRTMDMTTIRMTTIHTATIPMTPATIPARPIRS
jgi:hypothetical protein